MATVIEFHISDSLPNKSNYIARKERGKVIEFRSPKGNHENSHSAQWPAMYGIYCTIRCKPCEQSNGRHHLSNAGKKVGDPGEELR